MSVTGRELAHGDAFQKTGVSVYVPKTAWSASTISPSVACTRAQSRRFGIRLTSSRRRRPCSSASARSTAAPSRRARTPCEAVDLLALQRRVDAQDLDLAVVALGEVVDADDDPPARSRISCWRVVRGVGDLALREAALDGLDHPAERVDLIEVLVRVALHLVRERLDEVGAAERVDRVRDAGLVGDHLLRAQRDPDRLLARQRERLVVGVGVQRLRPAQTHRPAPRSRCGRCCSSGCCAVSETPAVWVWKRISHDFSIAARRTCRAARAPRSGGPRGTWRSPRRSRCAR